MKPNNILLMSDPESLMFAETVSRKTSVLKGKQNELFPEGPDIKFFVIFLNFHFNGNWRITGANQNSLPITWLM